MTRTTWWLAIALLCTACGQKGPLYLPDQAPPHARTPCDAPDAPCRQPAPVAPAADGQPYTRQTLTITPGTTTPAEPHTP